MDIPVPEGFTLPDIAEDFTLPGCPYPAASARVDDMIAEVHRNAGAIRFGPRLSAYERAYVGRADESAAFLAERYQISKKYVHALRRQAREEDGQK